MGMFALESARSPTGVNRIAGEVLGQTVSCAVNEEAEEAGDSFAAEIS
jgi:hypothetical protein